MPAADNVPSIEARVWHSVQRQVSTWLPEPAVAPRNEIDGLVAMLDDGRPINARPLTLPDDFSVKLDAAVDAERFYATIQHVGEQPCSLSAILSAGWRYKLLRTYPLCDELMRSTMPWQEALGELATHVQQRCDLLQLSVESAHVQQVLVRWRDA